jgi:hypothetical protein
MYMHPINKSILHHIRLTNFNKNKKWQYSKCIRSVVVRGAGWLSGDRRIEPSIFRYGGGGGGLLGGPVQNNLLGEGGGLSRRPGQEVIHKTLYTSIRPKELSARHQFSGSQDAHNTSLDLITTCLRSHFQTGRTVIHITLIGITV